MLISGQGRDALWEIHKDLGILVLRFIIEEYGFPEAEKHSSKENGLSDFSLWREVLQDLEDGVRSENIFL